ncbi:MAG: FkbM family methyltransferase [Oscillatoriales cyanobacterium SM2_2_1]|nr:FkbM family methyltransferase [Oscillatoriales cyanobacterium SM2_2_1]
MNVWLTQVLPHTDVVWDVGANDGYFAYGAAQAMHAAGKKGMVIAFEPGLDNPEFASTLVTPSQWPQYQDSQFTFVPQLVGATCTETTTTLDAAYARYPETHSGRSLVKVDVEGAELEVLAGAQQLLAAPHHWVVEVHGKHLLDPVLNFFRDAHRPVTVRELTPHWLLGREQRTIPTVWVTTEVPNG